MDQWVCQYNWFMIGLLLIYTYLFIYRLLLGFISRQEAEDFLHKSENGTFLIRFSDSELGGVTVAWITVNETGIIYMNNAPNNLVGCVIQKRNYLFTTISYVFTGQREVAMLQPFTRKDLMIRSLPDRLKDCPQMMTLFPNKPKDQVFGSFYR